jgi:hypothetical protein
MNRFYFFVRVLKTKKAPIARNIEMMVVKTARLVVIRLFLD